MIPNHVIMIDFYYFVVFRKGRVAVKTPEFKANVVVIVKSCPSISLAHDFRIAGNCLAWGGCGFEVTAIWATCVQYIPSTSGDRNGRAVLQGGLRDSHVVILLSDSAAV